MVNGTAKDLTRRTSNKSAAAMALSKIKTTRADRDDIYRRMVAEQIVKHLLLCGWRLEKPPLDAHPIGLVKTSRSE